MLRATLRSLLSRKLRLVLSGLAVLIGVTFVSGAFVLTDTLGRSFDNLFTDVYATTQLQVSKPPAGMSITGQPIPAKIPAGAVAQVQAVPGVRTATGEVFADGAKMLDKNGKIVLGTGAPRYGAGWRGTDELVQLREGRGPQADTEIAISANLAKTTGYRVGDDVKVATALAPDPTTYHLVGITGYVGGRDSLAGETIIYFTVPVAQRVILGEPGVFSDIDVKVDPGADQGQVRDRIATALGGDYQVRTGAELAEESAAGIKELFSYFNYVLLGFAAIALFVGTFLILNTFSIIVAQRTRELALMRALGASRGQVIGSVLVEAVLIGLVASVLGLGLGIGVGVVFAGVMGSAFSGGQLQLAGVGVPAAAIIAAFAVGIGITVIAAVLPAIRASRIAPIAAMRDSTIPDRPLTGMSIAGAVVLAAGGTALGLGLTGHLGDADLWGVLGGLLVSFIGVALLTPLVSRPVVAAIGGLLSFTAAAALGRRNSARNPRRTAITAAALMVGIALVTGISVIFESIKASTVAAVDAGINAEVVIAADPLSGGLGSIAPDALQQTRNLPGVESAAGLYLDLAKINGTQGAVQAVDDLAAARSIFEMTPVSGSLQSLAPGTVIVDQGTANTYGITTGSSLTIQTSRADPRQYTVAGVYQAPGIGGIMLGPDAVTGFDSPAAVQAFLHLSPGTNVDTVLDQVNQVLADSPEVSAAKISDYVAQQAQVFDIILWMVQLLLGLAMFIAILGIINTLALSMIERTRELGLLRAVGMRRGQVMWMVTVESIVISVFGALLGVVVGSGLGAAVFRALEGQGFNTLAFPWLQMVIYLIAAVVVGLVAGFFPALRAARQDVLRAVAYE